MSYKSLINKIDELRTLVGDWRGVQPSQLEMDMALERVKKIYELLRFSSLEEEQPMVPEVKEEVVEPIVEIEENFVTESISVVEDEPQSEPQSEPEVKPEPKVDVTFNIGVTPSEPIQQPEEDDDEEEMILDIDILKSANKERYNKILSLYCDLETQEPIIQEEEREAIPEPTPEPHPEEVTTKTTTTTTVKTTASTVSRELYKISSQLGINDRFLLANDLFGGDIAALSEALKSLDELNNIDDVMIYIAENYRWDGDSEGAKLLFTLLQNRFL